MMEAQTLFGTVMHECGYDVHADLDADGRQVVLVARCAWKAQQTYINALHDTIKIYTSALTDLHAITHDH